VKEPKGPHPFLIGMVMGSDMLSIEPQTESNRRRRRIRRRRSVPTEPWRRRRRMTGPQPFLIGRGPSFRLPYVPRGPSSLKRVVRCVFQGGSSFRLSRVLPRASSCSLAFVRSGGDGTKKMMMRSHVSAQKEKENENEKEQKEKEKEEPRTSTSNHGQQRPTTNSHSDR